MISYEPFFETLKKKKISLSKFMNSCNIGFDLIYFFKHNKPISKFTLNSLCSVLECDVEDIMIYKEDPDINSENSDD